MPSASRKKTVAPAPAAPPAEATEPAAAAAAAAAPAKGKKAAAKKPVKVVAVVTPDGIEGSFQPEPRRPLIAHLAIKPNEVMFHDEPLRYDPTIPTQVEPEPYDARLNDVFCTGQEELGGAAAVAAPADTATSTLEQMPVEVVTVPATAAATSEKSGAPCFKRWDLMVQFRGASEQKKLPEKTDIACFWCAHTFDWMPCVIPEREVTGVYTVYGNFCCPECAVSFLLTETIDPHVRWERMALLHRVYDPLGRGRIFPAPARDALELFGGPMTIEMFRATATEKRVRVDVHMPPMVSILGSIDTKPIDFFDTTVKGNGAVPITGPSAGGKSVEEGLRLKRSKPLKERESTLDSVMNIRIGGARGGAARG